MDTNDGCGRFWMNDVSVVWSRLLWQSVVPESWCMPLALIYCSTAVMPTFFLLGNFLFSFLQIHLSLVPLLSSDCFAFKAACTARVQYCCVLRWEHVSSVWSLGGRGYSWGPCCGWVPRPLDFSVEVCCLFVTKISLPSIVKQNVAIHPLWVREVEDFTNELFHPVCSVDITIQHC